MSRMVEAPAVQPHPFGLLSAAVVVEDTDPHLGFGPTEWETDACGTAHTTIWECREDGAEPRAAKTTDDGVPLTEASPFTVYRLSTCRTVGQYDRAAERAGRSLLLAEGHGVEAYLLPLLLAAATDVTPAGGPMHPTDALGVLEQESAERYAARPTFLVPRLLVPPLREGVARYGNHLETMLGSYVGATGGWAGGGNIGPDPGTAPAAGALWMVATGLIHLRRGGIEVSGPTTDLAVAANEYAALAERTYTAGWECFVVAVQVEPSVCCGVAA